MKTEHPLKFAQEIAVSVGSLLLPNCQKLNIAGSIRRRKPIVHDIELVCLPQANYSPILFSEDMERVVAPEFVREVASLGTVIKGKPDGKYMQINLHQGIVLDLFMPDPWDYFRQYAIRTGSADYSAKVIAGGWKKLGWCGSDQGLRRIVDCQNRSTSGKMQWICVNPHAEKPMIWESEEHFFDWLGVPWIKPELRNV